MSDTKRRMEHAVPVRHGAGGLRFRHQRARHARPRYYAATRPLMPAGYYTLTVPALLRTESRLLSPARRAELERFTAACRTVPELSGMVQKLFDHLLPRARDIGHEVCPESGGAARTPTASTAMQHEQIQADLRSGRIGLAQNRLPARARIEDVHGAMTRCDVTRGLASHYRQTGMEALAAGKVAVVTLAGGAGSRWTGRRRGEGAESVLQTRRASIAASSKSTWPRAADQPSCAARRAARHHHQLPDARRDRSPPARANENYGYPGPLLLSPGAVIGLRMVPMERDLRFAWEEMPQQMLDEQAQKVRESLHAALIGGPARPAKAATTPTICRCNACIRSATGTRSRTCCATERCAACSRSDRG